MTVLWHKWVYNKVCIMNYVSIVNLIFLIIGILVNIYLFHFIFFAIAGVIHKRKFPKVKEKCRYGVLISAKDEENVIPRLINSIRSADYPQEKLDIFIIAHNCKDKTGDIARSLGANVIVYNDENARTLGAAYHYAFKQINVKDYDGFIFLNADNEVNKDYFEKINEAFVYHKKDSAISSFRHTLNIKDGTMPALYSYYFAAGCSLAYIGRECLNVACRVTGCGFLVPSRLLENGWNYTSITEDIEFSADSVLNGETIHYCDDAIFYDEQPCDIKTMWFQRLRWAKGQTLTCKKYFPKFLKALFSKNKKNRFSLFVALTFNSFVPLMVFTLFVLQYIVLLCSPLAGVSLKETFMYWNSNQSWYYNLFLSLNTGALFGLAKSVVWFFLGNYVTLIMTLIAIRGKFKGQPKWPLIKAFVIFPLFVFIQLPLDIISLFIRNLKWRKIPHGVSQKK